MYQKLLKHNDNIPRYTSYPTAPHFKQPADTLPNIPNTWLDEEIAIYCHIPYCHQLCWFCGCHTKITQKQSVIDRYMNWLIKDIEHTSSRFNHKPKVQHIHLGGGTPNVMSETNLDRLMQTLQKHFNIQKNAEISAEFDPRFLSHQKIHHYADHGFNRVSFGVQDFNLDVQRAINRIQPYELVDDKIQACRKNGINQINIDLIYGLPHQTLNHMEKTLEKTFSINPSRIALFGYAHVPWMKKHMKLIPENALPGPEERLKLFAMANSSLLDGPYHTIGLDHFALSTDSLYKARKQQHLYRNFMGYTDQPTQTIIAFGASAISQYHWGYAQAHTNIQHYLEAIEQQENPWYRGYSFQQEDVQRKQVIEHIMCYLSIDLSTLPDFIDPDAIIQQIKPLINDGLLMQSHSIITVHPEAKQASRLLAACFDTYFKPTPNRHAQTV
ncbi:MAG: oxygen-independent coproporphyrinogen III oxidase [Candidatus Comchoanobacterales bacterium]